jgi:hypothetical protein
MTKKQTKKDDKDSKMIRYDLGPNAHPFIGPEAHVDEREKTQCSANDGAILLGIFGGVELYGNDII